MHFLILGLILLFSFSNLSEWHSGPTNGFIPRMDAEPLLGHPIPGSDTVRRRPQGQRQKHHSNRLHNHHKNHFLSHLRHDGSHVNSTTTFAMGDQSFGQLGDGAPPQDPETVFPVRSIPVGIPPEGSALKEKIVTKIDGGGASTYFLVGSEGRVFGTGYNSAGQVGIGNKDDQLIPVEINTHGDLKGCFVVDVSAGNRHALFLDSNGIAYATGLGSEGQLSSNGTASQTVPRRIKVHLPHEQDIIPKFKNVEAGYFHSFFLTEDGLVFASGSNDVGQCATGHRENVLTSVLVPSEGAMLGQRIRFISAGYYHSLFLSENGEVFSVGFGGYGQLATLSTESSMTPLAVSRIPGSPLNASRIVSLAAGAYFSVFVDENGHVYTVGQNSRGMLGLGRVSLYEAIPFNVSTNERLVDHYMVDVKVGHQFVMLLDTEGNLFHFGDNQFGQSGRNEPIEYFAEPFLTWNQVRTFGCGLSTTFIHETIMCHDGFFWSFEINDCSECPSGHYCPEQYAYYAPRPCPDYQWSDGQAKSSNDCSADLCEDGYICKDGLRAPCPRGEWSTVGDRACRQCDNGYVCLGNGERVFDRSLLAFLGSTLGIVVIFATVFSIATFVIFCIALCVVTYCVWRSKVQMREVRHKNDTFESLLKGYNRDMEMDELNDDVQRVKLMVKESLLEIDFNELVIEEKIGSGGGESVVFRANWNDLTVAVKLFKTTRLTGETFHEEFQKELGFMSSLRHPRLVMFFGCCLQYPRLGLVLEYCARGSVASCIKKGLVRDMSVQQIYKMLLEICDGMMFLHRKGIIHRDLKCDNVFLTEHNDAKIADFGLSRHIEKVEETLQLTSGTGTSYYMAPEVLRGESHGYDFKVDVFSFSIMLMEICSGKMFPYPEEQYTPMQAQMKAALDPTFRPTLALLNGQTGRFPELIPLAQQCWDVDPTKRPTFEQVSEQLKDIISQHKPEIASAEILVSIDQGAQAPTTQRGKKRRKSR